MNNLREIILFFIEQKKNICCVVLVYVDDLLVNGDDMEYIIKITSRIHCQGLGRGEIFSWPRSVLLRNVTLQESL